jgi:hypothetical protein
MENTTLSPEAQVVRNAYTRAADAVSETDRSYMTVADAAGVAAAIRSAAGQVVPEEPYCHEDDLMSEYIRRSQRQETRAKLLAIADELETL